MADQSTIDLVRSVAPEFSDAATFPDAVIAVRIDGWADAVTGFSFFLGKYETALAYAAAHRLTLDLRGSGGTGSGSGSATPGAIAMAKAGPQSIGYAANTSWVLNPADADWASTTYGMAWLALRDSRLGVLPSVVCLG